MQAHAVDRFEANRNHGRQLRRLYDELGDRPLKGVSRGDHRPVRFKSGQHDRIQDFPLNPNSYFGGVSLGRYRRHQAVVEAEPDRVLQRQYLTPTLVIHSEGDLRCNIEQGEQVFAVPQAPQSSDAVCALSLLHDQSRPQPVWAARLARAPSASDPGVVEEIPRLVVRPLMECDVRFAWFANAIPHWNFQFSSGGPLETLSGPQATSATGRSDRRAYFMSAIKSVV